MNPFLLSSNLNNLQNKNVFKLLSNTDKLFFTNITNDLLSYNGTDDKCSIVYNEYLNLKRSNHTDTLQGLPELLHVVGYGYGSNDDVEAPGNGQVIWAEDITATKYEKLFVIPNNTEYLLDVKYELNHIGDYNKVLPNAYDFNLISINSLIVSSETEENISNVLIALKNNISKLKSLGVARMIIDSTTDSVYDVCED